MATLDRSQLSTPVPTMRIALESRDGAVFLHLNPSDGEQPLWIRMPPKVAVSIGSELLELGLLLAYGPTAPQGN
jgi:hypothetical protein